MRNGARSCEDFCERRVRKRKLDIATARFRSSVAAGRCRHIREFARVVEIRKEFRFEAAHVLPHHPGKCGRLHGHSYRVEVAVAGPLQNAGAATGMVVDFDELAAVVRPVVIDRLDHSSLNDAMPNPTAEHIALWIWKELVTQLPQLVEIVVWETPTARAVVRAEDARAR